MHPWPFVKKNKSLVLFQAISFTSKLNCSSARTLSVRVSMNVTKSSLFPTAIVWPSGDHVIFIFSPFVLIVVEHLPARTSHIRTVLSPLAVLNKSGCVACQHNWSTDPVWPLYVLSFAFDLKIEKLYKIVMSLYSVWPCQGGHQSLPNDRGLTKRSQLICRMIPKLNVVHRNSSPPNEPYDQNKSKFNHSGTTTKKNRMHNLNFESTYFGRVCFLFFTFIMSFEMFLNLFNTFIPI